MITAAVIFVSYAREQEDQARTFAVRLRAADHRVFIDESGLAPGLAFDEHIRRAIYSARLFVFLISPESVQSGYALTELRLAEGRWPNPSDRVLPVLLSPTAGVPPYLTAVTMVRPPGDLAAKLVHAVSDTLRRQRRALLRKVLLTAAPLAGLGSVAFATASMLGQPSSPVARTATAESRLPLLALAPAAPAPERGPDAAVARPDGDRRRPRPPPPVADPPPRPRPAAAGIAAPPEERPEARSGARCLESLDQDQVGWWLTCRCPDDVRGPRSELFAAPELPRGPDLEKLAKNAADARGWRCP